MKQVTLQPVRHSVSQKDAWLKVKGLWRNKKPNPIKVLKRLRQSWERVYR